MYSTRLIHLMMVALSVSSVTGVAWLNPHQRGHEVKRQDDTISISPDLVTGSAAADPTSSSTEEASSASSTAEPSSTPTSETTAATTPTDAPTSPAPTSDNTTPTTSNAPAPTSTAGQTTTLPAASTSAGQTSPAPTSTSSGSNGGDQTSETPATTAQPTTSTFVTVITSTDAAGQTFVTSSSSTVVSTPTVAADSSNQTTSMPQSTINTIIGVCVGVGGAIVLAAGGVLFWRLRNKRRNADENEELVSYGDGFAGPGSAEKTEPTGSQSGRSPFQSTLESYHAPSQTNAASNF
ncbi:hypothetical protein F4819DRAFT_316363 [Hypoxylon fuscum]|nr:hypothetical protein F4819DRAFT_316363 [Hypoxylon fuscum]